MSKTIWLDEGTGPNPAKMTQYQFQAAFEDVRDATQESQRAILKVVKGCGVYGCSQGAGWPQAADMTGSAWADWMDAEVKKCDLGNAQQPMVYLNCETHDTDWLMAMLQRWRQHRPRRATALVIEGHQGGWFSRVAPVSNRLEIGVIAEAYHSETERMESGPVLADIINAGVDPHLADTMLLGNQLGYWWDNPVFSAGKLP
jgi:hypothetical protein